MKNKMANDSLANSLESIVGSSHFTTHPGLLIYGFETQLIVFPSSSQEVVECLKACGESESAVVPAGHRSWIECGNPLRRADVVLSLERMNRVIEYSPPDLTATVEAGVTLADFNSLARAERQWLPLDPPGAGTLGAIAATASFGPLRAGFGTPRDYVIGLRLAHIDGSESRSGGKVVKNVAGYDLNKLYIGSFGTLAVITEITFKLRPLPEMISTLIMNARDHQSLVSLALRSSDLQPASMFITRGISQEDGLALRFAGSEAAVRYQIDYVINNLARRARLMEEREAQDFWTQVADIDKDATVAVRASVKRARTTACFEKIIAIEPRAVATADLSAGIIRMAFDADEQEALRAIEQLRTQATSFGGTLLVERAQTSIRQHADVWGDAGAAAALMKSIKAAFDPRSLLNPGRFVAGI
jgi:glycolate oxidase FAD binding subunit